MAEQPYSPPSLSAPDVRVPDAPALSVHVDSAAWMEPGKPSMLMAPRDALQRINKGDAPMVCHARTMARRIGAKTIPALDVLELFAFARPAEFCLPTIRGLARVTGFDVPERLEDEAALLPRIAEQLLERLGRLDQLQRRDSAAIAWYMGRNGWRWAPFVLAALGASGDMPHSSTATEGMKVWRRLSEWAESAPPPPPGSQPVEPDAAEQRLNELLGEGAEQRSGQLEYARQAAVAFWPRQKAGEPSLVLAEAGTGVGKTLGYVAPASLWAENNAGTVWLSTYTRNLQRQLNQELDRLYPEREEKRRKAVVRKGRENYLCLLNFEEALGRIPPNAQSAVALGLMARWTAATENGDMIGGDFPAWLTHLLGGALTVDLTDTRGECIYSACPHYKKCFIERSVRRARRADIVVANHALVIAQAARALEEDPTKPTRFVFDEGHHLFDAADNAFSAQFSGVEAAEMRRWFLGAEGRQKSRARGLKARIEDLIAGDENAKRALGQIQHQARILPTQGWHERISRGEPQGDAEKFLMLVRQQVHARVQNANAAYDVECEIDPPVDGLVAAAGRLAGQLEAFVGPITVLIQALRQLLDTRADELDTPSRLRIEAVTRSLERRGVLQIEAWRDMLASLAGESPPEFVDWFSVGRMYGREVDVGMHRHYVDPTLPFAQLVLSESHGALVTSATLKDSTGDDDADWLAADHRTDAVHLPNPAVHTSIPSPFDYAGRTRVLVVNDINKNDPAQVAAAYRELFKASGGGALGIFTAISRLRAAYNNIAAPLEDAGIPLLAQHVDPLDVGTLVDIFREEDDACLLGTDAVRDGVDVPGRPLRLIVFDRVPWPRPSILHRARKATFGKDYDDSLTRLKLKQAFGRLIRRADDFGVFVMLDKALPSRLCTAFPDGVAVERIGLKDAISETGRFLDGFV